MIDVEIISFLRVIYQKLFQAELYLAVDQTFSSEFNQQYTDMNTRINELVVFSTVRLLDCLEEPT